MAKKIVKTDAQKVFDAAANHVSDFVLRGKNRIIGSCKHGCEEMLYETRLRGAACALANMDAFIVLETAIFALEDSKDQADRVLAGALGAAIQKEQKETDRVKD